MNRHRRAVDAFPPTIATAAMLLCMLLLTTPAAGHGFPRPHALQRFITPGLRMQADLKRGDARLIADIMALGEAKRNAVDEILAAYEAEYFELMQNVDFGVPMTPQGPIFPAVDADAAPTAVVLQLAPELTRLSQSVGDFRTRARALRDVAMARLAEAVDADAAAKLPEVDRAIMRARSLPRGVVDGEKIDLIAIVARLDVPPKVASAIGEVMLNHELQLHDRLGQRDRLLATRHQEVRAGLEQSNPAAALEAYRRIARARMAICGLNLQTMGLLEALLVPAGADVAPLHEVRRAAYPAIYVASPGEIALLLAREFEVEPSVRRALESIELGYRERLRPIQLDLVRARQGVQSLESTRRLAGIIAPDLDDPTGATLEAAEASGWAARAELDDAIVVQLRQLLPPDLHGTLPPPASRPR